MPKHNPANERIKRDYFKLLKEARGYDESSIDAVAAHLDRFEIYTRRKGFDRFHIEQAIGFKNWLRNQRNLQNGRPLAKSTIAATLRSLREFFLWLSGQPGFRSRISFGDTAYFRSSEKDARAARSSPEPLVPSLEQIQYVLERMPVATIFDRRDRALIAFIILTGARDNAVASLRLGHVDLARRVVFQDPRAVRTKAAKAIHTWFFPVGTMPEKIVSEWVGELRQLAWGDDDALFPATEVGQGSDRQFAAVGFLRTNWSNADPIRAAFRRAFTAARLPYFNPHSIRKTLARLGERLCRTPEEFKAWSQNLGHNEVMTTFASYGAVPLHRQGEIILLLGDQPDNCEEDLSKLLEAAALRLKGKAA